MKWSEKFAEADALYRGIIAPYLAPGEPLNGVFQATQSKTFSAKLWVIGVTPQRLIMVEVGRKLEPKGEVVMVQPQDIVASSVDGFGGGLSHFLNTDLGDIRFDTASEKYKLLALGGGSLENKLAGEFQAHGKQQFLGFLAAARGIR